MPVGYGVDAGHDHQSSGVVTDLYCYHFVHFVHEVVLQAKVNLLSFCISNCILALFCPDTVAILS